MYFTSGIGALNGQPLTPYILFINQQVIAGEAGQTALDWRAGWCWNPAQDGSPVTHRIWGFCTQVRIVLGERKVSKGWHILSHPQAALPMHATTTLLLPLLALLLPHSGGTPLTVCCLPELELLPWYGAYGSLGTGTGHAEGARATTTVSLCRVWALSWNYCHWHYCHLSQTKCDQLGPLWSKSLSGNEVNLTPLFYRIWPLVSILFYSEHEASQGNSDHIMDFLIENSM